jgi:ketosteroid isomerase-like protein
VLSFDAREFIAQDDAVAVFGHFRYRAVSTGKDMETDWAIRIRMKDGRIARYHFFEDTFAIAAAFRHGGSWDVENAGRRRTVP